MPLLADEQCQNCGRHSEALHRNGSKCHLCAPTLRRCAGCKLTLYCDTECQRQHRPMHRPQCMDEARLTSLARASKCLKKFNNFKAWCRKNTAVISRNAHSEQIPHSKDHAFLVNYPECSGFWVRSSGFPNNCSHC
ncbi:hypothetical protein B0H14DRAFT_3145711 [Mycena olivaceomarginata]|nr:hypothetical protein B0H14DRAFT_3145711 [Mycena olivaceomarginata]